MKKTLHKQLFRGLSENVHGEVQYLQSHKVSIRNITETGF